MNVRSIHALRPLAPKAAGVLFILLLAEELPFESDASGHEPDIHYILEEALPSPSKGTGSWRVTVRAKHLSREAGEVSFSLSDFGNWQGTEWRYLELLDSEPAVTPSISTPGSFRFAPPEHWDGRARIMYSLRLSKLGSERHRRQGLLPTLAPEYSFGYSWNVLAAVTQDKNPIDAKLSIEVIASGESRTIVTGWAGESQGRQRVELDSELGNSPIAFGAPSFTGRTERDGLPLETFQFGQGRDVTSVVAKVLHTVAPSMGRHTGRHLANPYRVFVTDTQGGGMGSHHGLFIGMQRNAPEGLEHTPHFAHVIAHELFHAWLGITLEQADTSLVWFMEGFTDYFALWEAASVGLVSREYFAARLLELEAIALANSSSGRVAFGDPDVIWRDGDGPNETLAYSGAPVLAFALDTDIRLAGYTGLLGLIRDLLARGEPYTLGDIHGWLAAHGASQRYDQSIKGMELPSVTDSLALAGFASEGQETELTYFGLQTDDKPFRWTVLAVDPKGPGAKAGIRPGDVVTGFYPLRSTPARSRLETPYSFGLERFEPGVEGTFLGVERDGKEHKVFLDPDLVPGGFIARYRATGETAAAFFSFDTR